MKLPPQTHYRGDIMCVIPINKTDRVAIFIDNANLIKSTIKDSSIQRIVYESLVKELTAGRNLRLVHVHDSYNPRK